MKLFFYFQAVVFFLVLSSAPEGAVRTETDIINTIKPYGFDIEFLRSLPEYNFNSVDIKDSGRLFLYESKKSIFSFLKSKGPSGYKIDKNLYIKPKITTDYFVPVLENINSSVGILDSDIESRIMEKIDDYTGENSEGGIEIDYYF
ncbi:MAG: hypothetical protein ACQEQS_06520 [Thermodesulfobacteriota bacterium]